MNEYTRILIMHYIDKHGSIEVGCLDYDTEEMEEKVYDNIEEIERDYDTCKMYFPI